MRYASVMSPTPRLLPKVDYSERMRRVVAMLDNGAIQHALAETHFNEGEVERGEGIVLRSFHAIAYILKGEPLLGLRIATEVKVNAPEAELAMYRAEADHALLFALQALDEHARAIELAVECEKFSRDHGAQELIARSMRAHGVSLSVLGQHDAAIEKLQAAIALFKAHSPYIARTLHAKYLLLNAVSRAMSDAAHGSGAMPPDYAELARRWSAFAVEAKANGLGRLHAMAVGNAAIATNHLGDTPIAITQLHDAFVHQNALQLGPYSAATLCQIGAAHAKVGDVAAAIVSYQRGIEQYGESNPREVATAWRELSELQESSGDVAAALHALRQAFAAEKRFNDQAAMLAVAKAEQKIEIDRLAANWTRIAEEDALTGLPNRRAYEQRIVQTLNTLNADEHLALVIVDVDHFKRVNDEHGHQTGDQVLRALAQTLSGATRDGDFVARLGGEEFVVLIRCHGADQARQLAERAISAVRAFNWRQHCAINAVTASAGVGLHSEITATEPNVIKAMYLLADRRLYAAKKLGRDRVVAEG